MPDIGIRLNLEDNASSVAPRVAQSLQNVADAADSVNKSLDATKLAASWDLLALKIDKMQTAMQRMQTSQGTQMRHVGSMTMPQQRSPSVFNAAGSVIGRGTAAITDLSRGNVVGAGGDIMGTLDSLKNGLGQLGAAGKVATGALIAVGGTIAGINALSSAYEKVMQESMSLASALGTLGDDAAKNSKEFKNAMELASNTASEFGYSFAEGASTLKTLLQSGTAPGKAKGAALNVFEYARGFGIAPAELASFVGVGQRYGVGGANAPGLIAGGLAASGMGPARYSEYMQGTLRIFEEGLSRGITKGFEEISGTQNWLAQLGEVYRGTQGAQKIVQMSQATAQATALAKESDVFIYRAASKMAGGDYLKTMVEMEGPMTAKLFSGIYSEMKSALGGNKTDLVEQMRQTFGVSYKDAIELQRLAEKEGTGVSAAAFYNAAPKTAETTEVKLLRATERIEEGVRKLGTTAIQIKTGLLDFIADQVNPSWRKQEIAATVSRAYKAGGQPMYKMGDVDLQLAEAVDTAIRMGSKSPEAYQAATGIMSQLSSMSPTQLKALGKSDFLYTFAKRQHPGGGKAVIRPGDLAALAASSEWKTIMNMADAGILGPLSQAAASYGMPGSNISGAAAGINTLLGGLSNSQMSAISPFLSSVEQRGRAHAAPGEIGAELSAADLPYLLGELIAAMRDAKIAIDGNTMKQISVFVEAPPVDVPTAGK